MNSSLTATRLRAKIASFSGEVSAGLGKIAGRFVSEMLYGIPASQSVVLTKIARVFEETISLKKTHRRLSRNLGNIRLEQAVLHNVLSMAARHVQKDTLLVLDPSDLSKKYAEKMEHLCRVRDGSEGEVADGYPMIHVIGCELDSKQILPLYQRLYSYTAPDFTSENDEILKAIDAVMQHLGKRGIWVIDRGADRIKLFTPLLQKKVLFKMVRSYLRRWSIEETIRFIKTSYDLEDVRVLRYQGLQNLMPLVLAVIYFSAMVLDGKEKLKILAGHVLSVSKRVFGIPDFKYYALSDGLKKLFERHPGRPHRLRRGPPAPQLLLFET